MTIIQNDFVVQGFSGTLGKQLAARQKQNGQLQICASCLEHRRVGHIVSVDSHRRRLYDAFSYRKASDTPAQQTTMGSTRPTAAAPVSADVIHPPEIHRIDISKYAGNAGEPIAIFAIDDLNVSSVGVLIVSDEGILIEKGAAVLSDENPFQWTYTTTQAVAAQGIKIVVDVADVTPQTEMEE